MNLVKLIMDQLSGDTIGKLSGLLGTDRSTATSAVNAAVPSMLAGVLGQASDDDGARRLSNTLNSVDTSSADFTRSLSGDTGLLAQKGSNLFSSLFGSSTRSGIVDAISRFSGLGSGATNNLLSFLAPLVLGKVATAWKSTGGTTSALTSMFADQKHHIANALPSGFSLGSIPGLGSIGSALGAVGGAVGAAGSSVAGASRRAVANVERTTRSGKGWWAAVAALLALGFIVLTMRRPNEPTMRSPTITIPSADQITADFGGALNSLGDTFTGITDASSAQAAIPQLRDLDAKLDDLHSTYNGMSESGRSALRDSIEPQLNSLKNQASELLTTPDLNAESRELLEGISRKLTNWGITTTPTPSP